MLVGPRGRGWPRKWLWRLRLQKRLEGGWEAGRRGVPASVPARHCQSKRQMGRAYCGKPNYFCSRLQCKLQHTLTDQKSSYTEWVTILVGKLYLNKAVVNNSPAPSGLKRDHSGACFPHCSPQMTHGIELQFHAGSWLNTHSLLAAFLPNITFAQNMYPKNYLC